MYCNLLLMASLSTMWTVVVGFLAVVTLVSVVLFLLKSREVTTLKKEVEELRDTMRMMRYEEINLSRMLHTVDKDSLTPNPSSEENILTPNPSPEESGTAGIAEVPEEAFPEEPIVEESIAEESISKESLLEELDVKTAEESLETPSEILESPSEILESPKDTPAPVVIATHKQAINERRPAIPNDLFAAWFAENDAPQVEEEVVRDVEKQATPAPAAVVPIVEEPAAAPSVNDIPATSDALMESPVVEAPASSPVHESEDKVEAHETESPSLPKMLSKEDEKFCRKLERLVNTRMRNPNLNIDVIAAQFGIGRTNFYRKVRELMEMSPNDYLRKCRMERAAELLRSTEQPVADICAQVGMPDAQYFSRVFKSYFGMPPSAYREQQD